MESNMPDGSRLLHTAIARVPLRAPIYALDTQSNPITTVDPSRLFTNQDASIVGPPTNTNVNVAPGPRYWQSIRVFHESIKGFDDVMNKLYDSIGNPGNFLEASPFVAFNKMTTYEELKRYATGWVGEGKFMIMMEIDRAPLMALMNNINAGRGCKKVLLGNPLVAYELLRYDLKASHAFPIELTFLETENGGTEVAYDLPSHMVVCSPGEKESPRLCGLVKVLERIDNELAALVTDVMT